MSTTNAFMLPEDPAQYRNVVVLGPTGSGKSTLIHALASASDTPTGAQSNGPTQTRTTELTHLTMQFEDRFITLLDTPGHPEFLGAVRAGLRAADAALFVVSAIHGIDQATALLWQECEVLGLPRAIVATHVDQPSADVNEVAAIVGRLFTGNAHVLAQPVLDDSEQLGAIINLLDLSIRDYTINPPQRLEPDEEHISLTADLRAGLMESVITESEDEVLLDQFLQGEDFALELVATDLERAVARGHFHPIVPTGASPYGYVGSYEVLELIARGFPSPAEHLLPPVTTPDGSPTEPLHADASGPLCAEVVATRTDRYTGKRDTVRVFSGTLMPSQSVHVSGHFAPDNHRQIHDIDERDGALYITLPSGEVPCASAPAGAIVTVSKFSHAQTGDTVSSPTMPLLMEPWLMPEAVHPVAIAATSSAHSEALVPAVTRMLSEDPTLLLVADSDTHQVVLWTLGEAHAEHVRELLLDRHGISTTAEPLRITLRETVTEPVTGEGRVVKQSGGHGQYAVCRITLEPLALGAGVEFSDEIVGGVIPRQFIGAVERGAKEQLAQGIEGGFPLTDVRIRLIDGKSHPVDSSDNAFATAGALAVREAVAQAQAHATLGLLEPLALVRVIVADDFTGAVITELTSKRGQITETSTGEGGRTTITALVPEANLSHFAIEMRALSHGTAEIHREFAHFAPMPAQAAARART